EAFLPAASILPAHADHRPPYAIRVTGEGLQVWWDVHGEPTLYPLRRGASREETEQLGNLIFVRTLIEWDQWVACWQSDHEGRGHPGLPGMSERVLPHSVAVSAQTVEIPTAPATPANDSATVQAGEVPQTNPA